MEGPAFSTKAESNVYRQWGMDIIGMTNLQEAKLAREAEIAYATLALVTDYDCWHEGHDDVTVDMVIEYLEQKRPKRPASIKRRRQTRRRQRNPEPIPRRDQERHIHRPRQLARGNGEKAGSDNWKVRGEVI